MEEHKRDLVGLRNLVERLRHLGVSLRWLEAEVRAGRVPCLRIGRRMVFSAEAVEAVLLDRARQIPKCGDAEGES